VRLFDDEPPRAPRSDAGWEQHRAHRTAQAGPPQDEVGVLVLSSFVLARNDEVAVAVRGVTAYSDGLLLAVAVLFADEQRARTSLVAAGLRPQPRPLPAGLRLRRRPSRHHRQERLRPTSSCWGRRPRSSSCWAPPRGRWPGRPDYWLHPLPPEGVLVLGCRWPDRRIPETLAQLDRPTAADRRCLLAAGLGGPTVTTAHEHLLSRRDDYPVLSNPDLPGLAHPGRHAPGHPRAAGAFADLWAEQGVVAWEQWQPHDLAVADLVGSIVGAPPGTTVMRQNVADLLGDVVSALDWRGERNRVVTDALDWPGSLHTFSQLHRLGGEAVVVPGRPDGVSFDLQRLLDAVDERTRLVYVSHVLFRTSTVVDVAAVVQRAHEVGALAWSTATRPPGPSRSTSSRSTSTSTWAGR
jgi:hypothetical protein